MTSSVLLPYSGFAHLSHFALAHGRAGTLAHRHVERGLVLARGGEVATHPRIRIILALICFED